MEDKPESKKNPSQKRAYVKPECSRIPLDDDEALLEYCKSKPYSPQELKDTIKEMLRSKEKK